MTKVIRWMDGPGNGKDRGCSTNQKKSPQGDREDSRYANHIYLLKLQ